MRYSNLLSALLLPGLLAGCGPATEEKTGAARQRIEEAGKQLEQTAKKIEHTTRQGQGVSDTLSAIGGTLASAAAGVAKVPPADFHELKAALPDELAGLPRKKMSGETSGTYGIQTSIAKATYATAAKRPRV